MLNITTSTSSEGAKAYFSKSDYLSEGQELVGEWHGEAARRLGLFGTVQKEHFDNLCDNLYPRTGEQLTAATRENRRVGYDMTWSAPKSISVVHALTQDDAIMEAFRSSIHETMRCFTVTITGLRLESLFLLLQDDRMRVVRQVKNDLDDQSTEPLVQSISIVEDEHDLGI
jgi:hypothetical protein